MGTWLAAVAGLILIWPGVAAIILAAISKSKATAATQVWTLGNTVEALKLSSTANGLRAAAVIAALAPLILVVLFVFAVAVLGQAATDTYSVIE